VVILVVFRFRAKFGLHPLVRGNCADDWVSFVFSVQEGGFRVEQLRIRSWRKRTNICGARPRSPRGRTSLTQTEVHMAPTEGGAYQANLPARPTKATALCESSVITRSVEPLLPPNTAPDAIGAPTSPVDNFIRTYLNSVSIPCFSVAFVNFFSNRCRTDHVMTASVCAVSHIVV